MDYNDTAGKVIDDLARVRGLIQGGYELANNVQGPREIISQALRESAAEAWTEAEGMAVAFAEKWPGGNSDPYPTVQGDIEPLAEDFADKAAALRGKP